MLRSLGSVLALVFLSSPITVLQDKNFSSGYELYLYDSQE